MASPAPSGSAVASGSGTSNMRRGSSALFSPTSSKAPYSDFFSSTNPPPASVTLLLTHARPVIRVVHRLLQLATWTSDRSVKSFLLLFAWWAICLGSHAFLIYGVHGAFIMYLAYSWVQSRKAMRITYFDAQGQPIPPTSPGATTTTTSATVATTLAPATPQSSRHSVSSQGTGRTGPSGSSLSAGSRHPTATQLDHATTLNEIQEILDHMAAFRRLRERVMTHLDWSDRTRTQWLLALAVVSYVPWLVLTYFVRLRWILAVAGSVVLCWRAPWFRIVTACAQKLDMVVLPVLALIPFAPWQQLVVQQQRLRGEEYHASYAVMTRRTKKTFSVKDIIARAVGQRKKKDGGNGSAPGLDSTDYTPPTVYKTSTGYDIEEDHATMYYKFVLYENQRWWLGLEWTPMMLPNDRAPWTDDHLEPTPSKSAFQLPPPHIVHEAVAGQPDKVLRKSQEWRWLDTHWHLKRHSDDDRDGWEYANNHWQKWSYKNRKGAYTRRRAWERTAQLIDTREVVVREDIADELGDDDSQEEVEEEVVEEEQAEEKKTK
ncbi:peroxisome- protein [Actinomortierella ambigua]|uniref:Peroxisome- protein n=1 Tax=Actinomortierella ambigua TaxID=1343610 RepID=A0A9P6QKE3_9FUNG|nr:peroxisome- protein [Actinomortierella ambigua]